MGTDDPEKKDERRKDMGRAARDGDSFLAKNLQAIAVSSVLAVFGGGGAFSFNSFSAKQDATNEKLDKLNSTIIELKTQAQSNKEQQAKSEALMIQMIQRIGLLEQKVAVLEARH